MGENGEMYARDREVSNVITQRQHFTEICQKKFKKMTKLTVREPKKIDKHIKKAMINVQKM